MSGYRILIGVLAFSALCFGDDDATTRLNGAQIDTRAAAAAARSRVASLISERRDLQKRANSLGAQIGNLKGASADQYISLGMERDKVLKQIKEKTAQINKEIAQLRALGDTETANELALKARRDGDGGGTYGAKKSEPIPRWAMALAIGGVGAGVGVAVASVASVPKGPRVNTSVAPAAPAVQVTSSLTTAPVHPTVPSSQLVRLQDMVIHSRFAAPRPSVVSIRRP